MKLGRPVFMTTTPLNTPTTSAMASAAAIASQTFQPYFVARMAMVKPAVPVMTPAEMSNSPPIMSRPTATAMMPYVDAMSSQFEIPAAELNTDDWAEKNTKTTIAPITEASSGRTRSRRSRPTWATRSSTGGAAVAIDVPPAGDQAGGDRPADQGALPFKP